MSDFFIAILLVFNLCHNSTNKMFNYDILRCIEAKQTFPQFNDKGKLVGYKKLNIKVYYYRDMTLYNLFYQFDSSFENKKVLSERRSHFFVFKNGAGYGFDYDQHKSPAGKRISLDSLFRIEWIVKNYLYGIFRTTSPVLLSSEQNKDSGTFHIVYSFRDKADNSSVIGTCYLGFTENLKDIDVSLSKQLDSMYKMKLYKARFVYNKRLLEDKGIVMDEYESNFSLQEIQVENRAEIIAYFTRFMEDEKISLQ